MSVRYEDPIVFVAFFIRVLVYCGLCFPGSCFSHDLFCSLRQPTSDMFQRCSRLLPATTRCHQRARAPGCPRMKSMSAVMAHETAKRTSLSSVAGMMTTYPMSGTEPQIMNEVKDKVRSGQLRLGGCF